MDKSFLPVTFLDRLQVQFPRHFKRIRSTFKRRPPVIRTNTLFIAPSELQERLRNEGFEVKPVEAMPGAFLVPDGDRKNLTELAEYHEGLFYIQSLASQLIVRALDPRPGERILDLCAAPGSKTSQIAILMQKRGLLMANDEKRNRFFRLKAMLKTQRVEDFVDCKCYPGQNYPHHFPEYFDKVLVDTSCSSEATFVENQQSSIGFWSPHKVRAFSRNQRKLLGAAIKCTRPGGVILYSTCTFAVEENEVVLDKILKKYPEVSVDPIRWKGIKTLPLAKEWNGKSLHPDVQKAIRLFPDEVQQGFFIARLKKGEA